MSTIASLKATAHSFDAVYGPLIVLVLFLAQDSPLADVVQDVGLVQKAGPAEVGADTDCLRTLIN